jgi:hypothetical protein
MNIPSLPVQNFIDEHTGDMDSNWRNFFVQLLKTLQTNASEEGLVSPTQSASNITIIQNNQLQNLSYTCAGGTLIYNSTTNALMVAILAAGIPTFKTVTVT